MQLNRRRKHEPLSAGSAHYSAALLKVQRFMVRRSLSLRLRREKGLIVDKSHILVMRLRCGSPSNQEGQATIVFNAAFDGEQVAGIRFYQLRAAL